jgi:hypothetical protein
VTTRIEFWIFAILLSGYGLGLLGMFAAAMMRARKRSATNRQASQSEPLIREELIHYLAGNNDLSPFRRAMQGKRASLETVMLSLERTAGGSALERLCDLALQLGLVRDWCEETRSRDTAKRRAAFANIAFANIFEPCRRRIGDIPAAALEDRDPQVRLSAGRAMARSGEEDAPRAFEWILTQALLARILTAPDLRAHAQSLSETAIPAALRSPEPARVRAALEVLIAWDRAIPSPQLWEAVRGLCLAESAAIAEPARQAMVRVRGGVA